MNNLLQLDKHVVVGWNNFLLAHPLAIISAKALAVYSIYLIPLACLLGWFMTGKRQRQLLLSALASGILAWQVLNRVVKLFYFHQRPDIQLAMKELIFTRPENSFPSDHAAFLAGIAFFFLFRGQKKPGFILLALTILVSLARIAVGVHYPSDIIAGFASGLIVAWVMNRFHETVSNTVWEYVITMAHRLRLA